MVRGHSWTRATPRLMPERRQGLYAVRKHAAGRMDDLRHRRCRRKVCRPGALTPVLECLEALEIPLEFRQDYLSPPARGCLPDMVSSNGGPKK